MLNVYTTICMELGSHDDQSAISMTTEQNAICKLGFRKWGINLIIAVFFTVCSLKRLQGRRITTSRKTGAPRVFPVWLWTPVSDQSLHICIKMIKVDQTDRGDVYWSHSCSPEVKPSGANDHMTFPLASPWGQKLSLFINPGCWPSPWAQYDFCRLEIQTCPLPNELALWGLRIASNQTV